MFLAGLLVDALAAASALLPGPGRPRVRGALAAFLLALPVVADLLVRVLERAVGDSVCPLALAVLFDGGVVRLGPCALGLLGGALEGRWQLLSSRHVTHLLVW